MAFCYGLDGDCRVFVNHPCESPTLTILGKTSLDAGDVLTRIESNGVITTIRTTPEGKTTVVSAVGTESTTTVVGKVNEPHLTFAGEGKTFDTQAYYSAREIEELFVDIKELMLVLGVGTASIVGFIALMTELVAAWTADKIATLNGLRVRAYLNAGNYGGEDPANRTTYRGDRKVILNQQNTTIDGVKSVALQFKMIKGDRGKPGECRRS